MEEKNNKDGSRKDTKIKITSVLWPIYSWVYMLMGKGVPVKKSDFLNGKQSGEVINKPESDDSVIQDIKIAKDAIRKLSFGIFQKTQPKIDSIKEKSNEFTMSASRSIDKPFLRVVFRMFVIIVFSVAILAIIKQVVNRSSPKDGDGSSIPLQSPAPTSYEYYPQNPSIYAQDEVIVKFDENLKVLLNEMLNKKLIEDTLKPPILDMQINFKD